ncbi:MAG: hypothetical protein GEU98_17510 [Pseudonocardiaceae bacterium]|nr:hypothetical protein [Pseudonocardiaceae bacterium]
MTEVLQTPLSRAAFGLGAGAAASVLLSLASGPPLRLISLNGIGVLIMIVLAALAMLGGLIGLRLLVALAGLGFLAAAALVVVQWAARGTNTLGGTGATMTLMLGFAIGLLAVGSVRDRPVENNSAR